MANRTETLTINVRSSGAQDATAKVRELSRAAFEAKTLLGTPLKLRLNVSEFNNVARSAKTSLDSLAGSVRTFRTLLFGAGVEKFAAAIITGTDALTNLENKIKVTLKANEDLNFTMTRLLHIANETRTGIEEIGTVYARTSRSVELLGVSQGATMEFTKALSMAIKVGGSTALEAKQSMIQLSQGMASGTLKGDELRSVLEGLPVVAKLIADTMGTTVGELRQLGAEGKITADKVFLALLEGADEMEEKFNLMTPTFEQSWEVFKNTWVMGLKMFQPLISGTTKLLDNFIDKWGMMGDFFEEQSKIFIENRDKGFFGQVWAGITERGRDWKPGEKSIYDVMKRKRAERIQEQEDEDLIQKGEAMADMYDLIYHPPKMPKTGKGRKEGGLTFAQLIEKMRQEQEVAGQTPFESAVTKEFFQKMGELKKSVREGLIAGAGKGGSADEQLRQLQDMIRLEHELAEAQKFVRYWDEKIAEEKKKQMQISIDLGKKEEEARARNQQNIDATNRAIAASLDPFYEYNKQILDLQNYMNKFPEQQDKVIAQAEKMGYAYQTFAPVFQQMSDGLADAAASALVFGNNLSDALKKIAQQSAFSMLSGLFRIGIGAAIGVPMPGINGGNALTAPVKPAARGGYMSGPGYYYGGYTGSYARGDIAGVVHGQEFVVNANATARNRAMLESMNAGKPVGAANVNVHNYAGVQVEASANNNGDVEIMIHKAIAERAPAVIAQDLRNRNGRVAKALRQNYEMTGRT